MKDNLKNVLGRFGIEAGYCEPYGNGHINDTFLVKNGAEYILQRINKNVFTRPDLMMENIVAVTSYLREKIAARGGDPDRETLTVIRTTDGAPYAVDDEGQYWRVYKFITGAVSVDIATSPDQLYHAARAFGGFQNALDGFPASTLHETIVNFHNTVSRFDALKKAIDADSVGRLAKVGDLVEFALAREADTHVIVDALASGALPMRVTHNDTKLNNVLLDEKTGEGVCVIDLDTVMPGSMLYDYGDALRSGGTTGAEDEPDLGKIWFNLDNFTAFTRGFIETLPAMTKTEKELLPLSVKLMTYECGIRFLADYLSGDTYFKIKSPDHNLLRTRTQFKLVSDIEKKTDEMMKIIASI